MFCQRCGAENPDYSFYCFECGADLSQALAPKKFRIDPRSKETQAYFHPDMVIGKRYKILKELGRGGRGVVYKAMDQQLQMIIAMKFLPQEMATNAKAIEDLKREAKSCMMLTHQNIVRLYNFEIIDKYTFLTMEYIDGPSLEDSLQQRTRFTLNETIEYARQTCEGLEYAHRRGIVHRDIKPANIMKTKFGVIKITDFGIAANIHDLLKKMTKQTIVGTPLYMSPEQLLGEPLDHRSDIYSLGAAIYEFLSGQPPFFKGAIEYQIINEEPQPIPDMPEQINGAILKALEKDREKRWKSAIAFSDALEAKEPVEVKITEEKSPTIKEKITGGIKSFLQREKKTPLPKPKAKPLGKPIAKPLPEAKAKPYISKADLWKQIKPYMLRHSILILWPFVFSFLLSYASIKMPANWTEFILLFSIFLQAIIIGLISKLSYISLISIIILTSSPFLAGLNMSESYLFSRSFSAIAITSLLFAIYAFFITSFKNMAKEKHYSFWRYRDIIWIGWAFTMGYLFIPSIEAAGIRINPIFLFLANALILGFLCRNLVVSLLLLPIIILGWAFSETSFLFLVENFKNLSVELRVYSLLMSVKSLYLKIAEFAALTFIMTLGAKLSFTIANQIKITWKKVIAIFFMLLFLVSLGLGAFRLKIFRDTSMGNMIWIPEGEFLMGTNPNKSSELAEIYGVEKEKLENEQPQRVIFLKGFYIDKFEVTNIQYKKFIEATNYNPPENWSKGMYALGKGNHPVVGVSLKDAAAYAKWAGKSLPDEMMWEKAARGVDGREYPWKSNVITGQVLWLFSLHKCNIDSTKKYGTVPVGSYLLDRSPWEVYDMAGNAMEWVDSPYKAYTGSKYLDEDYRKDFYVLRGGSWFTDKFYARSAARVAKEPDEKNLETGFRCVLLEGGQ